MFKIFKSTSQTPKIVAFNAGLFPVANGDWLVYRNGQHISQYSSLILCYKGKQVAEIHKEGHDYRNPALAPDGTVFFLDATGLYVDGLFITKHQKNECKLMMYKDGKVTTISKSDTYYYSPYGKAYIEADKYIVSAYCNTTNYILEISNNKISTSQPLKFGYNETAIFKYNNIWYGLARKGDWGIHLLGKKSKYRIIYKEITNLDHPADICKVGNTWIAAIGGRGGLHGNIRVFKGKNPLTMWDNETDYYIGAFDDFGYPTINGNTIYFYGRHARFGYLLFSFRIDK